MGLLQLKVNEGKSFVHGQFRESCGVDGFKGYDVTPLKPRTLVADGPAARVAVIDTINNLFNKGLWNASHRLETLLPERTVSALRIVGPHAAGFTGLASFSGSSESHLHHRRWNRRLQRSEVKVWGSSPQNQGRDRNGFPALLDFFASRYNSDGLNGKPRVVSSYAEVRGVRDGLRWEPTHC
jgi:hypothetical protein